MLEDEDRKLLNDDEGNYTLSRVYTRVQIIVYFLSSIERLKLTTLSGPAWTESVISIALKSINEE